MKDIYFTTNGYQESDNSTTSENIAIIELQEKIVFSPSVFPACVNWENDETLYPNEDTIGQVSEHPSLKNIFYVVRTQILIYFN